MLGMFVEVLEKKLPGIWFLCYWPAIELFILRIVFPLLVFSLHSHTHLGNSFSKQRGRKNERETEMRIIQLLLL